MKQKKLSETLPKTDVDTAVNQFAAFSAHLYYHLAKAVVDRFGKEGEEAISEGIHAFGKARGERVRDKVLESGLPNTMNNEYLFHDLPIGSTAWEADSWDEDGKHYTNVITCPFAKTWLALGGDAVDLGKLYCQVDYAIWEGYNQRIDYSLNTNVLDGAPHCAMCYDCMDEQ